MCNERNKATVLETIPQEEEGPSCYDVGGRRPRVMESDTAYHRGLLSQTIALCGRHEIRNRNRVKGDLPPANDIVFVREAEAKPALVFSCISEMQEAQRRKKSPKPISTLRSQQRNERLPSKT